MKLNSWRVGLALLVGIQILHLAPYFGMYTNLPDLFGEHAGVAGAILTLTAIVVKLVAGRNLEYWKTKNVLIAATLFNTGVAVSYHLIELTTDNVVVIVGVRIFHGIAFGVNLTTVDAIARRIIPESQITLGMGLLSTSVPISYTLFGIIGLRLNEPAFLYNTLTVAALIASLLAGLLHCLLPEENPKAKNSATENSDLAKRGLRQQFEQWFLPQAIPFSIIIAGVTIYYGSVSAYLPQSVSLTSAERYILLMSVVSLGSRLVAGYAAKKRGEYQVTLDLLGCLILSIPLLVMGGPLWSALSAILVGIGFGQVSVVLLGSAMKKSTRTTGGKASSTFFLGHDSGMMLGFLSGSYLGSLMGYDNPSLWWWYLVPLAGGLVLTLLFRKHFF